MVLLVRLEGNGGQCLQEEGGRRAAGTLAWGGASFHLRLGASKAKGRCPSVTSSGAPQAGSLAIVSRGCHHPPPRSLLWQELWGDLTPVPDTGTDRRTVVLSTGSLQSFRRETGSQGPCRVQGEPGALALSCFEGASDPPSETVLAWGLWCRLTEPTGTPRLGCCRAREVRAGSLEAQAAGEAGQRRVSRVSRAGASWALAAPWKRVCPAHSENSQTGCL